jgi:hypothetical protein
MRERVTVERILSDIIGLLLAWLCNRPPATARANQIAVDLGSLVLVGGLARFMGSSRKS